MALHTKLNSVWFVKGKENEVFFWRNCTVESNNGIAKIQVKPRHSENFEKTKENDGWGKRLKLLEQNKNGQQSYKENKFDQNKLANRQGPDL